MTVIELKEPTLVKQIEQLASETTRPVEDVVATAVRSYLDEREQHAIRRETQAFWAMRDELLKVYPGQHVALYQGKLVDHDEDAARLEKRVRERWGSLPVLIAPVEPGPRRDLLWWGGRIDKN
jgi:serine phosphatase RsbU (regulator of sigma subunit)